jgi:hypothetical protein
MKTLFPLLFCTLGLSLSLPGCSDRPSGFERITLEHFERYPEMQVQDLYKLAYQGALGNEHLTTDSAMVMHYLLEELKSVSPSPDEPLLEEINAEGTLVRVNLRPYKAAQLDPDLLFQAMIGTAATYQVNEGQLESYLRDLQRLARLRRLPFSIGEFLPYIEQQRFLGFPAVHHSSRYVEHYHPSYRVVLRALVPEATAR